MLPPNFLEVYMNELARFVSFSLGLTQNYRIVDRDGNPWFVTKDVGKIFGIKNYRDAIRDFPENEKGVVLTDTPGGPQKTSIINEQGLFRLILKSRKQVAQEFKEKLATEILPAYRKHGIHWAALPKIWNYRGQMLNYAEWRANKEEAYFKRFPDASPEDFLRTLPLSPPEYPPKEALRGEAGEKQHQADPAGGEYLLCGKGAITLGKMPRVQRKEEGMTLKEQIPEIQYFFAEKTRHGRPLIFRRLV
jgi:prophage antirepressor-like protein